MIIRPLECFTEKQLKEALKNFMKWKAFHTEVPELAAPWVLRWIDELPAPAIQQIWKRIDQIDCEQIDDDEICPFCIVSETCETCEWSKHYKDCLEHDSLYTQSLDRLGEDAYTDLLQAKGFDLCVILNQFLEETLNDS